LIEVFAEAIDALLYAGIIISQRYLDKKKTAITDNYLYRVDLYLEAKKDNIKLDKSKSNLKEIIEADKDSSQNQKIENEEDILEVFRKDKQ
ncbi:2199_t:CDS:2, partial [Racocetra persica]